MDASAPFDRWMTSDHAPMSLDHAPLTVGHAPLTPARRSLLRASALLPPFALALTACGGEGGQGGEPDLFAELPRAEPGPAEGAGDLVIPFTAALLGAIDRAEVNAVCSPLSAQVALTMAGLGARGATRQQMEQELGGDMEQLARTARQLREVLAADVSVRGIMGYV